MKMHEFRLHQEPYDAIASGKKTIEARLFDEKRQAITLGDELVFISRKNPNQCIRVRVVALHKAATFQELFSNNEVEKFGKPTIEELTAQLAEFYSDEDQRQHGVVGIEFARID